MTINTLTRRAGTMILLTATLIFLSTYTTKAVADEGMWPMNNLPQAVYEQMQGYGFELPYEALYEGDGALMNAVVNFSGYCTGVVVSPDGLVFTNHHCGFDAIQSHSTVEHDYLKDGFYAATLADELPNEDMFVSFMIEQQDITRRLAALGINYMKRDERRQLIDSIQQMMTDSVKAIDKTLHVEIDAFYEGNQYWATTYRLFPDLRLVFTIPASMGKFGGDTDNWMWPRQTCDFSVFRIYADPETNGPAEYSEKNVPYRPARWARVSLDGYKEDDFSMTVGYPGSTSRYLSSYGIREMRDAENTPRAQVRGVKQEVMKRHMAQSDTVRIKYDSKYAHSSNYWKNAIGMNKCIDSIGIIEQKQQYETQIRLWQDSTTFLKGDLDFDLLERLYTKRFENARALMYFSETFRRTTELTTRAQKMYQKMELKGRKGKEYVQFDDNSSEWDEALEREVLAVLLDNYRRQVSRRYLPAFYNTIDSLFDGDCTAYVNHLWNHSMLMQTEEGTTTPVRIYQNKKGKKRQAADLGMQMGLDLTDLAADLRTEIKEITDSIDRQEKFLCAAKLRMEQDMPHYSDANFTMRLSYGQVGGFTLNGQPSGYYTTAPSIVDKMDQGETVSDYKAEPVMRSLMTASDYGPYQDRTTGEMQLCFLTNNDITGGNSGSPMFNGRGELIGLAFDGNWDSLSADIFFDSNLARCIGVDIRYVIYMMERWGNATRLLNELFPSAPDPS